MCIGFAQFKFYLDNKEITFFVDFASKTCRAAYTIFIY